MTEKLPRRFEPRRYSVTGEVINDWGVQLANLSEQRLLSLHAQWEAAVPGPDGWWCHGPIFLTFERSQLELFAYCFEFSVSLDTCDFDPSESQGDDGESIHVVWRESPWQELHRCLNQPLRGLAAIEGHLDGLSQFKGISLKFPTASFCFFDGADQLGYRFAPLPEDIQWSEDLTLRWTLAHEFI